MIDWIILKKVESFLKRKKPHIVIIAAAKVGGILANNNFKAEFIFENLSEEDKLIQKNVKDFSTSILKPNVVEHNRTKKVVR